MYMYMSTGLRYGSDITDGWHTQLQVRYGVWSHIITGGHECHPIKGKPSILPYAAPWT